MSKQKMNVRRQTVPDLEENPFFFNTKMRKLFDVNNNNNTGTCPKIKEGNQVNRVRAVSAPGASLTDRDNKS